MTSETDTKYEQNDPGEIKTRFESILNSTSFHQHLSVLFQAIS